MFALLNILGSEKYGRLHLLRLRNRDLCKYMKKHGRPNQQSYVVIHQIVQVFFVLIKNIQIKQNILIKVQRYVQMSSRKNNLLCISNYMNEFTSYLFCQGRKLSKLLSTCKKETDNSFSFAYIGTIFYDTKITLNIVRKLFK